MAITKYKTKKGDFWMLNAHLGTDPITGSPVRVTRRGFRTKREAEAKLSELQYEFDKGTMHAKSRFTFEDVYKMWLKRYAETVKESSLNNITVYFRLHILPYFGKAKIDDILPIHCQEFADIISKKFKDYRKVYAYAIKVFDFAYKMQLTEKQNPFLRVVLPKNDTSHKITPFLEKEELFELLEAMKISPKWYTYFRLLAFTGMRRGEALALSWDDVDFENQSIHVRSTVATGINNTPYITTPKTRNSDRVIDVDKETLTVLKNWKKKCKIIPLNNSLIFISSKDKPIPLSNPYQFLKRVIKANGFREVTVHSFRHTHCSMLFEAGWSIKDVQERLGHRDTKTTMDIYTHVTHSRKKKSMEEFVAFMKA